MKMKTKLRGALVSDGKFRLWTGLTVGVGVTYLAGKVMPNFSQIENDWLYPLPYCAPAAALGLLALMSPKTKRAGYGVLGSTAAYYLYAAISNMTSGMREMPDVDTTSIEGAPVAVVY